MARLVRVSPEKRIGVDAVQWRGDNENEVLDYARPLVFQDYTQPETPMMARTSDGLVSISVGEWIEVWEEME